MRTASRFRGQPCYVCGSVSIAVQRHGSGLTFEMNDWQGTKRAHVSSDGNAANLLYFDSLAFGDGYTTIGTPPTANDLQFTGREQDAETNNNIDFGAGYYKPSTGRFLSPDWSAKEEPVPYAKLDNPQSLNLYSYTLNNPLSNADTDGHACGGLYLNRGRGFCTRASEYGKIDAISGVQSQTRFFAAADAVSQALGDVATPRLPVSQRNKCGGYQGNIDRLLSGNHVYDRAAGPCLPAIKGLL